MKFLDNLLSLRVKGEGSHDEYTIGYMIRFVTRKPKQDEDPRDFASQKKRFETMLKHHGVRYYSSTKSDGKSFKNIVAFANSEPLMDAMQNKRALRGQVEVGRTLGRIKGAVSLSAKNFDHNKLRRSIALPLRSVIPEEEDET